MKPNLPTYGALKVRERDRVYQAPHRQRCFGWRVRRLLPAAHLMR
jgi:hypothetical protein